ALWDFTIYLSVAIAILPFPLKFLPQILLGAMFAHGIELQHELIHQKHFNQQVRSLLGFLCGLPMLVDFTRYAATHGHHHRAVGTQEDEESLPMTSIASVPPAGFLIHLSMLSHYQQALRNIGAAIAGDRQTLRASLGNAGVRLPECQVDRIRWGYVGMAGILVTMVGISVGLHAPVLLYLWVMPLLAASPIHALIELPEHWGCDRNTADCLKNTRTIIPSKFTEWFTNGNCWHVEHHQNPALPVEQLATLHRQLAADIQFISVGYGAFYAEFLSRLWQKRSLA
ncbi:MAG: hypothetical protein HC925_09125, partial [Coleofasciculaceae cyanobacterium SM2_3_26]|nr:hypothetical protein [Coleofasciculaceae cyanobacterium SM2_3_26]